MKLFDELDDAISHTINTIEADDVILLAGCQGMDFGASIALKQIKNIYPDSSDEELFEPLKTRVCGIE